MSLKDETLDSVKAENYLLGILPDDEAFDFECEVFPDENLSEQLDVVRNQLSEKYIRHELEGKQKSQFENYFLSFPYNAQIFSFQKLLVEEVSTRKITRSGKTEVLTTANQNEEKKGFFERLSEVFTVRTLAISAFAVLVLAVLGGIFLYNPQKSDYLSTTRTPILEKTPEMSPTRSATPLENSNNSSVQNNEQKNDNRPVKEDNQNKPPETPIPSPQNGTPRPRSPMIITIVLSESFRDLGSKEKPIVIGKETENVYLEFQYPGENAETPVINYKLILETVAGNKVWGENLSKDGKKSGDKLKENISPNLLQTGQYRFRVVGVSQNNREETVQSQTFFVNRIN